MIVDFNLFSPGKPVVNNALWVLEQSPGLVVTHDLSQYLQTNGYCASYNVVYDPYLRGYSGSDKMAEKYGYYYIYEEAPRGQMFKRGFADVVDMASMQYLMRFNNFTLDPLSSQIPFCLYQNITLPIARHHTPASWLSQAETISARRRASTHSMTSAPLMNVALTARSPISCRTTRFH